MEMMCNYEKFKSESYGPLVEALEAITAVEKDSPAALRSVLLIANEALAAVPRSQEQK